MLLLWHTLGEVTAEQKNTSEGFFDYDTVRFAAPLVLYRSHQAEILGECTGVSMRVHFIKRRCL